VDGRDQVVVRDRGRDRLGEYAERGGKPDGEVHPQGRQRVGRPEVVLGQGRVEDHGRRARARWHACEAIGILDSC
jgi:hypothetical protein